MLVKILMRALVEVLGGLMVLSFGRSLASCLLRECGSRGGRRTKEESGKNNRRENTSHKQKRRGKDNEKREGEGTGERKGKETGREKGEKKREKEKERKGMIQRREAQLPAGASGASAQSPPTAPLRAGGLRAIRRAGKRPARFRKNRVFCASGLKGLYERLVSQISIPQC